MAATKAPTTTILGRVPLMSNADRYVHLAAEDFGQAQPVTLCGYQPSQTRPATNRELATAPGTCSVCLAHHYDGVANRRPADDDRAGGRNTLTRFADTDMATP